MAKEMQSVFGIKKRQIKTNYSWPCVSGTLLNLTSARYCTVYVIFYKVPEQHGYVYLVGLYNVKNISVDFWIFNTHNFL